jgi:hypothetical protein
MIIQHAASKCFSRLKKLKFNDNHISADTLCNESIQIIIVLTRVGRKNVNKILLKYFLVSEKYI